MKLSRDEKAAVVSALSYAIAANEKSVVDAWRFKNLRTKFENAIRSESEIARGIAAGQSVAVEEAP